MDFNLTEDQHAFAATAQSAFADYCGDEQLRDFDASGRPFMEALWAQCVAMGLHVITVPEKDGGLGLGMTELSAVLEQQGRSLALVPLWEHQLAASSVAHFGTSSLRERLMETALDGKTLMTLSLQGIVSPGALLQAVREAEGIRLHGRVPAVTIAGQANFALLGISLDGVRRLALIRLDAASVTKVPGVTQHHLSVADLVFDGTPMEADALLAADALDWLEPRAIACLASLQLGVSTQQLQRTVEYVSERKQFDRVIGSFQLVAGQMADGYIALEALRSSLAQLVYRIDAGMGTAPQGYATRVLACETGHLIGHKAQHVHGGIGVDTTFHIHRFLFWSRALGLTLGGAEHNLAKLGDWLANNDSLGWKYDLAEDQKV